VAFSEAAIGEVHVLLPSNKKGTDWYLGSLWAMLEWPNLSSAVTRVIRVNPDNDNKEIIKGA